MEKVFEIGLKVRDYECDIQGIVNNANYQHYMEHARHEFLHEIDLDFAQLHNDGIDAVVIKAVLEYKYPLRPADEFIVQLTMRRQGNLRFVFDQKIIRKSDNKLCVKGEVTSVLTRKGRPIAPVVFEEALIKKGYQFLD